MAKHNSLGGILRGTPYRKEGRGEQAGGQQPVKRWLVRTVWAALLIFASINRRYASKGVTG